jgi:alginate O-acetyltransferase complex protein AlgI
VAWGLYHGIFLVLERTSFGKVQDRLPHLLRHSLTLLVVMFGWVLFRSETVAASGHFFVALFGVGKITFAQFVAHYTTQEVLWAIGCGIVFSGPAWSWIKGVGARWGQLPPEPYGRWVRSSGSALELVLNIACLVISSAWLASGTYNPFIYFRF